MKLKKLSLLFVLGTLMVSKSFSQSIPEVLKYWANDTLEANSPRLLEQPTRKFTADDALNNKLHWANPYQETLVPNSEGFDFSKLGKVPATGIHPRIFTSPDEFASIKQRLETTIIGKHLKALAEDALTKLRSSSYYAILKTRQPLATDGIAPKEMANLLAIQGLLAQLYGDKALQTETGTVAANYLKRVFSIIDSTPQSPAKLLQVKEPLYGSGEIAKLFDFTAAGMSASDKNYFINYYTKATYGKYGLGMELPHHWRRWNHIAMSICYPLSILAGEGEKGYDKRIFERGEEVVSDYLTYSYTAKGMSSEGIVYTFGQFPNDMLAMAAIARRDKTYNTFTNPHFRAIPDWLIHSLNPNPAALWSSHGDTGLSLIHI